MREDAHVNLWIDLLCHEIDIQHLYFSTEYFCLENFVDGSIEVLESCVFLKFTLDH